MFATSQGKVQRKKLLVFQPWLNLDRREAFEKKGLRKEL